jgi:hypothetical protein
MMKKEKLEYSRRIESDQIHLVKIRVGDCVSCRLPAMVMDIYSHSTVLCLDCIKETFAHAPTIPIDHHLMLLEEKKIKVESEVSKLNEQKQAKEECNNRLKRKMCDLEATK